LACCDLRWINWLRDRRRFIDLNPLRAVKIAQTLV